MRKGRRQKLKTGDEVDYVIERGRYCYLKNNPRIRDLLRKCINRRYRKELKAETQEELREIEQ
jgi:hypothetical protein